MEIKIIITKVNEVFVRVQCDKGIARELADYFTFFVPGYQFSPQFRNKIWDGKIKLFDLRSFTIYHGLLPYIETFAQERGYKTEYQNPRPDLENDYSVYLCRKYIESLHLQSDGEDIEFRDYQENAYIHCMQVQRTLILSPTSSGKSLIIYVLIRQLLQYHCKKGLIIVPTTSLVEQLYSDFADYSTKNGWPVQENVHKIYQGKDKNTNLPLTISTWQSLYTMPMEYFKQFDFVVGDEAHLFKSKELTKILSSCINAKYRIGLTGTLDGTKTHKLVLEGLFGVVKKNITTKELMNRGQIADLTIKCLILKHSVDECKLMLKKEYRDEMEFLISNEGRNKFIKNLAISLEGNTLVLFQYIDKHGKILYDMIRNSEKIGNRKVYFISGKTDTDDREEIRKILEKESNAILIASYGTLSTGVNIKNLHNAIFASPYKSIIKVLQSIGRILRLSKDKTTATLYDISDDMRIGDKMNHTLKHFVERTKIYNGEKFNFKLYKIGLKNGGN